MTGVTEGPIACRYSGSGDYSQVGSGGGNSCLRFKADQWMTFYFHVHFGDSGQPNSTIKAWMGYEDGPLMQFIDIRDHAISIFAPPATNFDTLWLLPYMTGKKDTVDHPTGFAWYDEVIVSSQPIFDVGAPEGSQVENSPPSSPVDLKIISP